VELREIDDVIGATALTAPSLIGQIRLPPSNGLSIRSTLPITDEIIRKVHVREGDFVKKGQVVFEVDNELYQTILEERSQASTAADDQLRRARDAVAHNQKVRQKELSSAEAESKFRTEDLDTRQRVYDLLMRLKDPKAVSTIELLEAKSKLDQAIYELSEAKRRVEYTREAMKIGPVQDQEELSRAIKELAVAKYEREETRRVLDLGNIKSPLTGYIDGLTEVVADQTVSVTHVLARVLQLDPIYIRLDCPQERSDEVYLGQPAEVVLDSYPGETFQAKVVHIGARVSPDLRVFPVYLSMPNSNFRIRAGISGFARLKRKAKACTVPSAAVIRVGGAATVFCVEDGRAHTRAVRLGRTLADGSVEVLEGLQPGDSVVLYHSNFYRHWSGDLESKEAYLKDGDPVDTDWRNWARRD
jgi:RND family efflux transporter MFP subunit